MWMDEFSDYITTFAFCNSLSFDFKILLGVLTASTLLTARNPTHIQRHPCGMSIWSMFSIKALTFLSQLNWEAQGSIDAGSCSPDYISKWKALISATLLKRASSRELEVMARHFHLAKLGHSMSPCTRARLRIRSRRLIGILAHIAGQLKSFGISNAWLSSLFLCVDTVFCSRTSWFENK